MRTVQQQQDEHGEGEDRLVLGFDAAEQTGKGLLPTWTSLPFGPPATVDHILADKRCAVNDYSVHDLPGGDHKAVLTEIVLP